LVLGHLNILLVAGHETTTVLGAYVLYLLATLPAQRQRGAAELDTVLGETADMLSVATAIASSICINLCRSGLFHVLTIDPSGILEPISSRARRRPRWISSSIRHW